MHKRWQEPGRGLFTNWRWLAEQAVHALGAMADQPASGRHRTAGLARPRGIDLPNPACWRVRPIAPRGRTCRVILRDRRNRRLPTGRSDTRVYRGRLQRRSYIRVYAGPVETSSPRLSAGKAPSPCHPGISRQAKLSGIQENRARPRSLGPGSLGLMPEAGMTGTRCPLSAHCPQHALARVAGSQRIGPGFSRGSRLPG